MISDGTYEEFECALSDDKHFLKEPISLPSCGHSVCKQCIPLVSLNQEIVCKLCGKVTKPSRDLRQDPELVGLTRAFKRNIEHLFQILESQSITQLNKLKNNVENKREQIETHVEFIKSQIETRIEILKKELDDLNIQFRKQLDDIKKNMIRVEMNEGKLDETHDEAKHFEKRIKQLRKDLKNKMNLDENRFYDFQDELIKFNKIVRKNDLDAERLEFIPSRETISEKLIGQLMYENFQMSVANEKELRNKIKNSKYEVIEVNTRPYDVCVLANGYLLSANRGDGTLTVFDNNFKIKQTIDKIDNKPFKPRGIASNHKLKEIYILDELESQVILTDIEFNKLESFGSFGSKQTQFDDPSSMCFKNDFLYITDRNNERIQVLTNDLELSNTIELSYKPYLIKVSHKRICITCIEQSTERGIYFYDTDTFQLQQKYDDSVGKLSEINSYFYLLCSDTKMLSCFNTDGVFFKEVNMQRFDAAITDLYDGNLFYFNQILYLTSYRTKKFLKL